MCVGLHVCVRFIQGLSLFTSRFHFCWRGIPERDAHNSPIVAFNSCDWFRLSIIAAAFIHPDLRWIANASRKMKSSPYCGKTCDINHATRRCCEDENELLSNKIMQSCLLVLCIGAEDKLKQLVLEKKNLNWFEVLGFLIRRIYVMKLKVEVLEMSSEDLNYEIKY